MGGRARTKPRIQDQLVLPTAAVCDVLWRLRVVGQIHRPRDSAGGMAAAGFREQRRVSAWCRLANTGTACGVHAAGSVRLLFA
jgi:hypothetical protein